MRILLQKSIALCSLLLFAVACNDSQPVEPTESPYLSTTSGDPSGPAPLVYVTNGGSNNVSVIETANNTVVATVPVGSFPVGVGITPDGAFAYIANSNSNNVSVIETTNNTVVATVPVGSFPVGVEITPDGAFAYVTNRFGNTMSVIETTNNTVVATIPVSSRPFYLDFTSDGGPRLRGA